MNEEKERDSRKKRNPLFYVFAAIFAAAVIFGIVYYVAVKRPQNKRGEIYDELAEAVEKDTPTPSPEPTGTPTTAPTNTPGNTATESPTATETPVPVDIPVSFEEAWKTNKDIYAWIRIYDQTSEAPKYLMNYPILQSVAPAADNYYLDHTVNHKAGLPGSIYTRRVNAKDFSDHITVIYGHNMGNGTMFGLLNRYTAKNYANTQHEIKIFTPEHILTYEIFAGVTYDNRMITTSFNAHTEDGLEAFLNSLKSVRNWRTYWRDGVTVTKEDRIIVLSTCNGNEKQRFLLCAVLVDEQ